MCLFLPCFSFFFRSVSVSILFNIFFAIYKSFTTKKKWIYLKKENEINIQHPTWSIYKTVLQWMRGSNPSYTVIENYRPPFLF